ncbi:MAG TPA: methyltransferase domain-containing protein [Acidimicrobiales bacterium]|nr:methyltransferase domain-containing protein [Acidimicrobiales bacterium]
MSGYALQLSEGELARYRMMAEAAAADEAGLWAEAGIAPGARVADVGCGPGAVLALLAGVVGPAGLAVGVDRDPGAVAHARAAVAGLPQAEAHVAAADHTGLRDHQLDVVMCRHVLAHNGGRELAIVRHLAGLVRPGGRVYLVDVDARGLRLEPPVPALDIDERYRAFHASLGNDLTIGAKLGVLLEDIGLTVERFAAVGRVLRPPPGMRPPAWAARRAMVDAGIAGQDDLDRWEAAFDQLDLAVRRPWMFVPAFVAIGRVPG